MKGRVIIALVAVAAAGLLYWTFDVRSRPVNARRNDVVRVHLQPIPEGPTGHDFAVTPRPGEISLDAIRSSIPDPLPPEIWQGFFCSKGGDVDITLSDGREIVYGPCRKPRSIDDLQAAAGTALARLSPSGMIARRADVVRVRLQPLPEGPSVSFSNPELSVGVYNLSLILARIPDPLPEPLPVGLVCKGDDIVIELTGGREFAYARCAKPRSIRDLETAMNVVIARTHPSIPSYKRTPYDGRIAPCRAPCPS